MDPVQLLLSITLTVTTIFLIVVGIQLIYLIRDTRQTLTRVNTILDSYEALGETLNDGLGEVKGFLVGVRSVVNFIDIFHQKRK